MQITHKDINLSPADINTRHDINWARGQRVRSGGLHVSKLIESIRKRTEKGMSNVMKGSPGAQFRQAVAIGIKKGLVWGIGIAWEEFCASLYPQIEWQPGEIELDGVAMSPDGIQYDPCIVHEFKLTWKSARNARFETDHWSWMCQTMAYCWGIYKAQSNGSAFKDSVKRAVTGDWRRAVVHAYYVNGIYAYDKGTGPQPVYRMYTCRYTLKDLSDNWTMLMGEKRKLGY